VVAAARVETLTSDVPVSPGVQIHGQDVTGARPHEHGRSEIGALVDDFEDGHRVIEGAWHDEVREVSRPKVARFHLEQAERRSIRLRNPAVATHGKPRKA
jgi:hypothetical protein